MSNHTTRIFKSLGTFMAALFFAVLLQPQAAQAAGVGTITVVSTGGSPENTNWTYSAGTITSSASVSINAADIVAKLALGNLTLDAEGIVVFSSISHSTVNSLTLKATGSIIIDGGTTIQSQGGDIIFNADSDANSAGFVRFGLGTAAASTQAVGAVNSNGGKIIVGGGANPYTGYAYAQSDTLNNTARAACFSTATPPVAGIGIYGFSFNSGNGEIVMRGASPNLGTLTSSRGINTYSCWGTVTLAASGSGQIRVYGDGSAITNNNAWGIATGTLNVSSVSGAITFEGRGNPNSTTNARGIAIGSASTFTSTSGNVSFIDTTSGLVSGYAGLYFGGAVTVNTGGTMTLSADELSNDGGIVLDVASATIQPSTTTSFTRSLTVGPLNATNADSLTIGSATNTEAITLSSAITAGGTVSLYGGAIAINAALTSTSDISITASGTVSQTAAISAVGLAVSGSGNVNLNSASNDVTRFAANTTGTLTFAETNGYSIGSVGSVSGVTAASQTLTVNGATNYRINFNSQGGSTVNPVLFASGGSATLPNGPSLSGYSFRGWFTASSGGTAVSTTYTPGVTSDVTLYAQWALIPPPVNVSGKVTGTGASRSISGSNFDRISSVLINGAPVKILSNDGSTITFEVPELPAGNHKIELVGSSIKLTWDNAIVVKAPPAPREFQASLAAFTGNSISAKQKTAIKTLVAGATALTCVATAAKTATTAQKKAALAQATSVCNYAKQANAKLTAATAKPTLVLAKKASSIALKVTK